MHLCCCLSCRGLLFALLARTDNRAVYEKLRDVISENKELEKMVSAGRVQQLGMEIGLLKRENEQLREMMEGFVPRSRKKS